MPEMHRLVRPLGGTAYALEDTLKGEAGRNAPDDAEADVAQGRRVNSGDGLARDQLTHYDAIDENTSDEAKCRAGAGPPYLLLPFGIANFYDIGRVQAAKGPC